MSLWSDGWLRGFGGGGLVLLVLGMTGLSLGTGTSFVRGLSTRTSGSGGCICGGMRERERVVCWGFGWIVA